MQRALLCLVVLVGLVGCRSTQLGYDQRNMRETLLELYQNQVLDNLVRAKKNLPIVHVDYSNLAGTITQEASVTAGDTTTATNQGFAAGAVGALVKRIRTTVLNVGGSAKNLNQLTLTGQPVIAADIVYRSYAAAAQNDVIVPLAKDTSLDSVEAHLVHKFEGEIWYVPRTKDKEFFALYMATTVQRQPKILPTTRAAIVQDTARILQDDSKATHLVLRLTDKVPNDSGTLFVAFESGIEQSFRYLPNPDPKVPPGAPTDELTLVLPPSAAEPKAAEALAARIAGKRVTLMNEHYPPLLLPLAADPIEGLRFQLEQQRLQQLTR